MTSPVELQTQWSETDRTQHTGTAVCLSLTCLSNCHLSNLSVSRLSVLVCPYVRLSVCLYVCLSPACLSVSSGVYPLTDMVTVVTDSTGTDSGKPRPTRPRACLLLVHQQQCSSYQLTNQSSLSLQQLQQEVPWPPVSPASCLTWPRGRSDWLTELPLFFQVNLQGRRACLQLVSLTGELQGSSSGS